MIFTLPQATELRCSFYCRVTQKAADALALKLFGTINVRGVLKLETIKTQSNGRGIYFPILLKIARFIRL